MKLFQVISEAAFFLQLVNVIAGNDVITFNDENIDEDNIDTDLKTEHFIEVVDRRNNIPPHNIAVKTSVYQNSSPNVYSQSAFKASIPNSRPPSYSDVKTELAPKIEIYFEGGGSNSSKPRTTIDGWSPLPNWENLGMEYNSEENEDPFETGSMYFPLNKDSSDTQHYRFRRAVPQFSGDGTDTAESEFRSTGQGSYTEEQVKIPVQKYFDDKFPGGRILITVRKIEDSRGQLNTKIITFDITYPEDKVQLVDLARALNDLSSKKIPLLINNKTYTVSLPMLKPEGGKKDAAICFLCRGYQICEQPGVLIEWICILSDKRLYPFGEGISGDKPFPPDNEYAALKLKTAYPIPFDSDLVDTFWVSANGILSAVEKFTSYSPVQCNLLNSQISKHLLAPYWTDLDVLRNDVGQVRSRVLVNDRFSSEEVKQLFRRANRDVERYTDEFNYNAVVLITVTWSDLAPYPVERNDNERVTFQLVIISNLYTTYAMYLYAQKAMNFNPNYKRAVEVCVRGSSIDITRQNYYQFDRLIGNTGTLGHWIFLLGRIKTSRTKCLEWFQSNLLILDQIEMWNRVIDRCPCSEIAVWFSPIWIRSMFESRCYDILPMYGSIGRRCCYRRDGSLSIENRIPNAGSLQMSTPYSGDYTRHEQFDAAPKRWCCAESNLCNLYYIARPVRSCRNIFFRRSFFFGDPHILTLDKQSYTFNGVGEFTLLEINGTAPDNTTIDLTLQGRTCRAKTNNGTLSDATVFCALALKSSNKTVGVRIVESANGTYMDIYINGQDFTGRFRDSSSFNTSDHAIYAQKVNDSIKVSIPGGIGFTVSFQQKFNLLDFSVEIDSKYKEMTKGLLGNFNGNKSDDYIFPNGTTLPNTTSDRELFAYGNSWRVSQSIFTYGNGENASTVSDLDFEPLFLDEVNATDLEYAKRTCGGIENIACVYDLFATKNEELAKGTKDTISTYEDDEKKIFNQAPVINGTVQLNVTVNETVTITLIGSDPDNDSFNFTIIKSPSSGFNYSENNAIFMATYMPTDLNQTSIEVVAQDSKGLQSEIATVSIIICSGCSNHGTCNFDEMETTDDPYYSIAHCDCNNLYTGTHCEVDKNGCSDNPCSLGTNCTDIPASEESITNKAFNCSGCHKGFQLNADGTKCEDIDECESGVNPCTSNANCTNIFGSYICNCLHGFRNSSNGICVDINECVENQHKCKQICNNTIGSYECSCHEGFSLDFMGFGCTNDPCHNLTNNCESGLCMNSSGVAQCFCEIGSQLLPNNTCVDIDECNENLCAQECNNTYGSYSCSCLPGFYLLDDQLSCDICPVGWFGDKCGQQCNCRGRATDCHHIKGCICQSNWMGPGCEDDVNECLAPTKPCPKAQNCVNNNGSYDCVCPTGYEDTSKNGSCYNIDECKDQAIHKCSYNAHCVDSPGSFSCVCSEGYNEFNNTCQDIDECKLDISGCQEICKNMEGSFNCECSNGYILAYDRKSCSIDLNNMPCPDFNVSCEHNCELVEGSPQCGCYKGYRLGSDNKTCDDVNECDNRSHKCSNNCVNTNSSYNCTCDNGSKLMNDKRNCEVCDGYHWGPECSNKCACDPIGSSNCDPKSGCICNPGWNGNTCNIDRNECSQNMSGCHNSSTCVNTPGSFLCQCRQGYQLDSNNICSDINECEKKPCDQTCHNTIGSYSCSCKKGFSVHGNSCIDIDECLKPDLSNCDQQCRNTYGSFACECNLGYVLNTTTRNTCIRDPLALPCNCSHFCTIINGIDVCSCRPGYQLATDNITCETCDDTHYGYECMNNCSCVQEHTLDCNDTTGECTCQLDWKGTICEVLSSHVYIVQVALGYTDAQIKTFGDIWNNKSDDFFELAKFIEKALMDYGVQILPNILVLVKITNFTTGSIIANTSVYIDEKNSTNPPVDAAKLIFKLKSEKSLLVNGSYVPLEYLKCRNTNLTDKSFCQILGLLGYCSASNECERKVENGGSVSCQTVPKESSKNDLIIGLAVGIPLFIIVVIIVALLALFYVRRKRKSQQQSSSQSVDHGAPFRSQFPTRVSTKGSWGAPHQLYAPYAFSEAGTSENGAGGLITTREKGRPDFQDSPWYENKPGSAIPESRESSSQAAGATSNFSWEYMFRLLEPHRDFEIQRPFYETTPNPAFTASSQDPDSAA